MAAAPRPVAQAAVPPRRQRGFSLLEQLAVLSVAGTLGAGALAAVAALDAEAQATALARLAADAAAAMALNQAGCILTGQQAEPGKCTPVRDCADVAQLLTTDLPAGYRVAAQPLPPHGARCMLQRTRDGASAGFHGAPAGG